ARRAVTPRSRRPAAGEPEAGRADALDSGRPAPEPAPRRRRVLGVAAPARRDAAKLPGRFGIVFGRRECGLESGVACLAIRTALDLAQHGRPFAGSPAVIVQTVDQLVVAQMRGALGRLRGLRRELVIAHDRSETDRI